MLLVAGFVLGDGVAPAGRRLAKVTGIDPTGYFGVSHAMLFHQNFNLAEEYQHVKPAENSWTQPQPETGHYGSVWAVGYSILAAPFLGAGTLLDALTGRPADGYSHFAILGFCLTNVVLTGLGLMALFSFTLNVADFWNIAPRAAAYFALFTTAATFLGTTVGYYAFSPMAHAAEFFWANLFLAYWWRVRERIDVRGWVFLGFLGGFLSITRWQDIFFLAAPILADALGGASGLVARIRSRIAYVAAAAFCWIPQVLEWKYIYNRFLTIPQGSGFFTFPPSVVQNVLFSTRSGWIAWTPLVLLGLCGLIWGGRRQPRLWLPWMVVVLLEVCLIGSSPASWHGGDGFGARYLTSLTAPISLGLVTLLCLAARNVRPLIVGAALACCLFSVVSAVEFRLDLIPHADRLTVSEYFTDKFRPLQVRRRKQLVRQAEALLSQGSPSAAVTVLEAVAADGPDRDVLAELSKAYRASGREPDARNADWRLAMLMRSRLF